jgi:DNA-binding HxlR family transcriptional regulator
MNDLVVGYDSCALALGQDLIAGKWKLFILWYLGKGTKRFSELYSYFRYTSRSLFIRKLHELEDYGLIEKKVYPEVPVRVEYSLTDIGSKLIPVLSALIEWSNEYVESQKEDEISGISFIHNSLKDKYKSYRGVSILVR